jgi:hypothetical protein
VIDVAGGHGARSVDVRRRGVHSRLYRRVSGWDREISWVSDGHERR